MNNLETPIKAEASGSKDEKPVSNHFFAARILAKIKTNKMAPKPRWQFLLKNYVVWLAGLLALLIGAAAVSVMIYLFKYNDWEIYEQTHKTLAEFFLLTLPYFWFIFLGFFVFVVYYNLKHTKHGYRYPLSVVILAPIALSIILGSGFFLIGWGERIDNVLGRQAPLYDRVINRQLAFWFNPEEGRLTGVVVDFAEGEEELFYLIDPAGNHWEISRQIDQTLIDQALNKHLREFLEVGGPVNLIGQIITDGKFQAKTIKPLMPGRGFFMRPKIRERHPDCFENNCRPPRPPFKISPQNLEK